MKRAGIVSLIMMIICFGAGCASAAKAALRTQKDPIALVSVVSNDDINWKGEDSIDPKTAGYFTNRTLRADPDLAIISKADQLINSADKLIRDTLADSGVINLADKETVFRSRSYQDARLNKYQINREQLKPDDYRFIDYRDKNFPPALATETGIRRSMYVEFVFTKSMATGIGKNGSGRASLDMTLFVLNDLGKRIYRKTYSLGSRSTMKVSLGVYSHSELISLFEEAIVDACYDFLDDLDT